MEIDCPNCGFNEAYHNGVCYECPECGYTWTDSNVDDI